MYERYFIRPLKDGLVQDIPSLYSNPTELEWPAKNFRIDQNSVKKRQGYLEDRDLGSGTKVQVIALFQESDTTRHTIYLTDTNACRRESSGTWSYITLEYTTGAVTGIAGAVVTGNASVDWATGTVPVAGDFFIMDTDHATPTSEPDTDWAEIKTVDSDTQITLVNTYYGATSSGSYTIRRVYSVPTNERWTYAIVADKFCFTNGTVNAQYYDGDATAELDATEAKKARYCLAYANRLFIADFYTSTTRYPFSIKWSKEGDPTDWTDNTAGSTDFIESADFITNLGQVGPNIIVYMRDSYKVGNRTGNPKSPVSFPQTITGIGLWAPYSLVHARGSNIFLWRDDFYRIDSSEPIPVGKEIRNKFFSLVGETELEHVYGYSNTLQDEVRWFATATDATRICVVWNYKEDKWYYFDYNDDMFSGGKGEG